MPFLLPEAPQPKGLRKYGLVTGTGIALIFGLFFPIIFDIDWPVWPHLLGGLFMLAAAVYPPILAPVYRVWMGIALVMGHINTKILLTIVYLFVLTPIGLMRRAFGADAMGKSFQQHQSSYRKAAEKREPNHMERPF